MKFECNSTKARPLVIALGIAFSSNASIAWSADATAPKELPTVFVHADADPGYQAAVAESTSRTAIPLKDLPASIQVVPHEVLRDRGVTRTDQLLDNVSGVLAESNYGGNGATFFNIRGFSENNGLRDGFRNYGYLAFRDVQNIEQMEVFKGAAGALYGGVGAVGGYVNTVSKRPGPENFGEVGLTLGSYGLRRSTLDVNQGLDSGLSVRLNGAYEKNSTFRDNAGYDSWSIAPAISWNNGRGTSLTLLTEFNHLNRDGFDFGVPNLPNYATLSRIRYFGLRDGVYPGVAGDFAKNDTEAATLIFEHALNAQWKVRAAAHYSHAHQLSQQSFPDSGSYTGGNLLDVSVYSGANEASRQYSAQAELLGNFSTGAFRHSLLAGIDYGYLEQGGAGSAVSQFTLDLFNPNYVSSFVAASASGPYHQAQGKDLGVYVQDLIDVTSQVKLHVGLRGDRFENRELLGGSEVARGSQNAFSPRIGLVWQPTESTALFTDWSRSHAPNIAHGVTSSTYEAELSEQVEVGLKQELIKNRLNATLAAFDLKRTNILTSDPLDPTRQVLTGKQTSRGVEFDIAGSITPAWKLIAAYTYTDAFVKSDNSLPVGDALSNVPRHHASVWNTYEFQGAALKGLGVGAGIYYVGEREANLPNTYKLPGYVRTDASLSYQSGSWRTQLNVINLFDRKYYTGGSASVFNYTLDPSRPLSAQLTVTYRF
ncbi:TonB-dependent siderophore receptor [Duganella sp. FT135W]|uniref:TonB-dependent siderophore receptor n=1 Tax=Duganella flavida TaxID=2692175 RepID=A0A6L8KCK9_9BURK|nr:TonB-dependent siderophore receptor [Duganella flavida]MYM22171.1 TonB-dependent siderophore receptor [Duganella flavida]